ncbi:argininosuccinate lyase [Methylohalomonas lacus]|uniref:Argininosuccinate lyase n=1 Tax=Methylohalomonas lacus TaxID=398773 RepID=A0AAE3HKY9_9GAMM|nr:argininosuccinate lyase [Methylohalomonas lacus]MCS3904159.1 argininosuccinate lyase [Methylohalomonas lacus]
MSAFSESGKLWGGRFSASTDELVEEFTASVDFDKRLAACDIDGSIAHVTMLARVGTLTEAERDQIIKGLKDIGTDIARGEFAWSNALEDVHMNIEARLAERIGDVGKKLHTGRSRNDQIATDIRLYLRNEIDELTVDLDRMMTALVDVAEREADTIIPGFTHLQTAQPVSFGHHMLAWFEMLYRDRSRLVDCRRRMNVSPLGAAALAGTRFPIDRYDSAEQLGFDGICENSLDAVSDRDFAIEFSSCASLIMMHLSRMSEELVLWMSQQFGFIDIDDAFCTGSSIMPQKKNPDIPELVRGKTGRVYGDLMALLTLMKAQPLAYNRDNQEDKEPLFDAIDTVRASVKIYAALIPAITVKPDAMREAARRGLATATDLADYLVEKGIAFRDAHAIVGQIVSHALAAGKDLVDLPLAELRQYCSAIDEDIFDQLSLEASVAARRHPGGTAPDQVRAAARRARERLQNTT